MNFIKSGLKSVQKCLSTIKGSSLVNATLLAATVGMAVAPAAMADSSWADSNEQSGRAVAFGLFLDETYYDQITDKSFEDDYSGTQAQLDSGVSYLLNKAVTTVRNDASLRPAIEYQSFEGDTAQAKIDRIFGDQAFISDLIDIAKSYDVGVAGELTEQTEATLQMEVYNAIITAAEIDTVAHFVADGGHSAYLQEGFNLDHLDPQLAKAVNYVQGLSEEKIAQLTQPVYNASQKAMAEDFYGDEPHTKVGAFFDKIQVDATNSLTDAANAMGIETGFLARTDLTTAMLGIEIEHIRGNYDSTISMVLPNAEGPSTATGTPLEIIADFKEMAEANGLSFSSGGTDLQTQLMKTAAMSHFGINIPTEIVNTGNPMNPLDNVPGEVYVMSGRQTLEMAYLTN